MAFSQTSNSHLTFSCAPQTIDLTGRTAPSAELDEGLSPNPLLSPPPPPPCRRSRDPALGSPLFVHDDDTPEREVEDEEEAASDDDANGQQHVQYALPSDYGDDEDMGCGMLRDGPDDDANEDNDAGAPSKPPATQAEPPATPAEPPAKHPGVDQPNRDHETHPADSTNSSTLPTSTDQTAHLTFSGPPPPSKKIDTFTIVHHRPAHPTASSDSQSPSRSSATPDFDWETLARRPSSPTHRYRSASLLLHRRTLTASPLTTAERYHPKWEASQIVSLRAQQTLQWSAIAARLNAVRAQRPGRLPTGDWTEQKVYAAFLRETAARGRSQNDGDGHGREKEATAPKASLLGGRSGKGGAGGTRERPGASRARKAAPAAAAPHCTPRLPPHQAQQLAATVAAVRARFWTDVAREMRQRGAGGKREGFWKERWGEMHPEEAVEAREWGGLRGGGTDEDGGWTSVEAEAETVDGDVEMGGADLRSGGEMCERQARDGLDEEWYDGRWGQAGTTNKRD